MSKTTIDLDTLERLKGLASSSPEPISKLSMDQIAQRLGIARMTLYRKAGSRENIVTALRPFGIDVARAPDVHERVLNVTTELLREQPLADITMELVARRAGCSLPAIYDRFGDRQGLLVAVMERHSPLLPMQRAIAEISERRTVSLRPDVRHIYSTIFYTMRREWPVVRSFLAETMRGPDSDLGKVLREWYIPQMVSVIVPILGRHIEHGNIRPLPLPLVVQFLAGPMSLHIASRQFVIDEMGLELPDPEQTIDLFTDTFCRAVGTEKATEARTEPVRR